MYSLHVLTGRQRKFKEKRNPFFFSIVRSDSSAYGLAQRLGITLMAPTPLNTVMDQNRRESMVLIWVGCLLII